jgi:hypothetical protein
LLSYTSFTMPKAFSMLSTLNNCNPRSIQGGDLIGSPPHDKLTTKPLFLLPCAQGNNS